MAKSRILIIDDDQNIRAAMQAILKRAGYEVETTPYLATAVGEALSGSYDLITLDLNMPGIDGRQIAQLFQNKNTDLSVLVISAFLSDGTTEELRKTGVKHFLHKPFNVDELPAAVAQALAG